MMDGIKTIEEDLFCTDKSLQMWWRLLVQQVSEHVNVRLRLGSIAR